MRSSAEAVGIVDEFIEHFPNLTIVPLDVALAREAARIRAATALKAPDALVLATANLAGIRIVVSNDDSWSAAIAKATPKLVLCHLQSHLPL